MMSSDHNASGIRKSSRSRHIVLNGKHRFEHWYRDNQVYFITARCRERVPAFACEAAKTVFWDRFDHYANAHGFTPWVTSLLDNHYHTLGYIRCGNSLGEMMRKLHGSVAKLVNDTLEARLVPFWRGDDGHDYFDGCIRDELQARRAYRYVQSQSTRHGVCHDWRTYPHTRVRVEVEPAIRRSLELNAVLQGVPYKRNQSH